MMTVIILCHADEIKQVIEKLERWFREDVEVTLSAQGTSEKQGTGVLILEFESDVPGPWFKDRMQEDDAFIDYIISQPDEEG